MTVFDSSKFILRPRTVRFTAFIVLSLLLHLLLAAFSVQHSSPPAVASDIGVELIARQASTFLPPVQAEMAPQQAPATRSVQSQAIAPQPKKADLQPIRKIVRKSIPAAVIDSIAPREHSVVEAKTPVRPAANKSGMLDANFLSPLASSEQISWKNRQPDVQTVQGQNGPGSPDKADQKAIPRYNINPKPVYPEVAIRRGYEGTVELEVWVLADGRVGDVEMRNSSGHSSLDREARKAVRFWTFQPALAHGMPIESQVVIPINFVIETK